MASSIENKIGKIMITVFDSHCHLEQSKNPEELIKNCIDLGIGLITSSARIEDFEKTLRLANSYSIYYSLGLHPLLAAKSNKNEIEEYISKIKEIKCSKFIGVGEVGLDFFLVKEEKMQERSEQVFLEFINLANEIKKPLIIHCRDAYPEVIDILSNELKTTAVFHYFNQPDHAKDIVDKGWVLSLPYVLSKTKIAKIFEEVGYEKIDHFLLETDSPISLDKKEITPLEIIELVEKIQAVTGIEKEKIMKKTTENVKRVFKI
ncbi:MAG: TatD family hydrolase [Candidatus Micrarchaeia archaeon]